MKRLASLLAACLLLACDPPGYSFVEAGGFRLAIARTPQQLHQGLSGLKAIPSHHGMIFELPEGARADFWMKDCLVGLDMIFLAADGKVQAVVHAEPPGADGRLVHYTIAGVKAHGVLMEGDLPVTRWVVEVPSGEGSAFVATALPSLQPALRRGNLPLNPRVPLKSVL